MDFLSSAKPNWSLTMISKIVEASASVIELNLQVNPLSWTYQICNAWFFLSLFPVWQFATSSKSCFHLQHQNRSKCKCKSKWRNHNVFAKTPPPPVCMDAYPPCFPIMLTGSLWQQLLFIPLPSPTPFLIFLFIPTTIPNFVFLFVFRVFVCFSSPRSFDQWE